METIKLPLEVLREATWNTNQMDDAMMQRLRSSIKNFGLVHNLVVRPLGEKYEVLSGNQRLKLLRELKVKTVPCVIVDSDDAHARLLAQALNHIHGSDDLSLRAELINQVMQSIPEEEILAVLPDTIESLKGMSSLSQETIAGYLQNWNRAQAARLKNLLFKLTKDQLQTIEKAIGQVLPEAKKLQSMSPNTRGTSLYLICKFFLDKDGKDGG